MKYQRAGDDLEHDQGRTVSLIIPTIRQIKLVEDCIRSIIRFTNYPWYEIIIVDDGSDRITQESLKQIASKYKCRFIPKPNNTGFASSVNRGVHESKGDFIVLINNDITFFNSDWLREMLNAIDEWKAGIVGARLLYPDGRIQHAGVRYIPALKSFDHIFRHKPGNLPEAQLSKDALAVTGALMLVRRETWIHLGGMSEAFFIAMEDVDFCLRAWKKDWRVVYCGKAVAYHVEGKTRGTTPENKQRYWYRRELEGLAKFKKIWFDEHHRPLFNTHIGTC